MDLVGHQGVASGNEVVLKPAAGDARGNNDHVPRRGFRRGFALAVHHPDGERLLKDFLGDGPDAQRLPGTGTGDDAEPSPLRGPAPQLGPVFAFEHGVDPGVHGKLDGLARGPSRGNDDHPAALV